MIAILITMVMMIEFCRSEKDKLRVRSVSGSAVGTWSLARRRRITRWANFISSWLISFTLLPLKSPPLPFGSVRDRTSLSFPSSHFWFCPSVMLILNVSPKMCFLDSTVLILFTLAKKPLCSRFTHFLFHKRFGSEYCNPCTVLNNISFLGESMVFLCVSLHIPFVHKRFLTHNTRSSSDWCITHTFVVQFAVLC